MVCAKLEPRPKNCYDLTHQLILTLDGWMSQCIASSYPVIGNYMRGWRCINLLIAWLLILPAYIDFCQPTSIIYLHCIPIQKSQARLQLSVIFTQPFMQLTIALLGRLQRLLSCHGICQLLPALTFAGHNPLHELNKRIEYFMILCALALHFSWPVLIFTCV